MPPNCLTLLKLVWHPDDVDDGKVKPTAFRRDDLSGEVGKHVSVDRNDLACRLVMEQTAAGQKAKANGTTVVRDLVYIGRLPCGEVRSILYDKAVALRVVSHPIDGNHAHCGIENISGKNNRAFFLEVRTKLAGLASPPVTLDEAYPA